MSYVLSWRRSTKKSGLTEEQILQFLRENPGIRWKKYLPMIDRPINYLEIGVFKGDSVIDMTKSYCKHPDSKLYCVDPWIDYPEYREYKQQIESVYDIFSKRIDAENLRDKITVYRDFSHNVVPTFQDNFFDIAFIDGNHETEFVYKDGVMVLPKMKSGGTLIFDDYDWSETKKGIDTFLNDYSTQLTNIRHTKLQLFVDKL